MNKTMGILYILWIFSSSWIACSPAAQSTSETISSPHLATEHQHTMPPVDSSLQLRPAQTAAETKNSNLENNATNAGSSHHPEATQMKKEPVKVEMAPPVAVDTLKYYYTGLPKRISLAITPWRDGTRKLIFYGPDQTIRYIQQDHQQSFSIITQVLGFQSNGAVAEIEISTNPDAGIEFFKERITFGIQNDPEWKVVDKYPSTLEDATNNHYYWKKESQQWIRQTVSE